MKKRLTSALLAAVLSTSATGLIQAAPILANETENTPETTVITTVQGLLDAIESKTTIVLDSTKVFDFISNKGLTSTNQAIQIDENGALVIPATITDLTITSNNPTAAQKDGAEIQGSFFIEGNNITLDHLSFTAPADMTSTVTNNTAIGMANTVAGLTVTNCSLIPSTNTGSVNNQFIANMAGSSQKNLTVTNNVVSGYVNMMLYLNQEATNVTVQGNTFSTTKSGGIFLGLEGVNGVTVTENIVEGSVIEIYGGSTKPSQNITITDNNLNGTEVTLNNGPNGTAVYSGRNPLNLNANYWGTNNQTPNTPNISGDGKAALEDLDLLEADTYYISVDKTTNLPAEDSPLYNVGVGKDYFTISTMVTPAEAGTLTIEPSEDGTVTFAPEAEVTISVKPAKGYTPVSAIIENGTIKAEWNEDMSAFTFEMPKNNVTLNVTFEQTGVPEGMFAVKTTANPAAGGLVEVEWDDEESDIAAFEPGDDVTVTITPNAGYTLSDVSVITNPEDEETEAESVTYNWNAAKTAITFEMPESDVTVSATFTQTQVTDGTNNGYTGEGYGFTQVGQQIVAQEDGSSILFNYAENGTKTAVTLNTAGYVTEAAITVPSTAVLNGKTTVNFGTIESSPVGIPGNMTPNSTQPIPVVKINLETTSGAKVLVPIVSSTISEGTVAGTVENNIFTPLPKSVISKGYMYIPATSGQQSYQIRNNAKSFNDVASNMWYYTSVNFVSARNIMQGSSGTGSTIFSPNESLTRGMLAQMIWNLNGNPSVEGLPIPNGTAGEWYQPAAQYVVDNQIMGYGSPFNGNNYLTRQELATIMYRLAGSPNVSLTEASRYADWDQVQPYARNGVAWAVNNGIMGDNSPLNPANNATRGEIAKMFMNFLLVLETE